MRLTRTFLGLVAAASMTLTTTAYADHGHASASKPTTVAGKPTTSTADQTTNAVKPTSSKPTSGKSFSKSTGKSSTRSSKSMTSNTSTTTISGAKGSKKSTTPTTMNPVAAKISSKPGLNSKVAAMLPAGMTLNDASKGFKNQGQFIAALHVSQNLGIPFADLKKNMTGPNHMSLGQAIQSSKKTANSTTEATKAQHQADDDLESTTTTTTSKKSEHKESEEHESEHHESERHESEHHESEHRSVAQQITANKQLTAKVNPLLPPGMMLKEAASGFRSESQFLSALHAAKDLNIPFAQIKAEMTGHDHDSLTRAIEELKPSANAATAAKTAQQEAAADIKSTAPARTADHDDQ